MPENLGSHTLLHGYLMEYDSKQILSNNEGGHGAPHTQMVSPALTSEKKTMQLLGALLGKMSL